MQSEPLNARRIQSSTKSQLPPGNDAFLRLAEELGRLVGRFLAAEAAKADDCRKSRNGHARRDSKTGCLRLPVSR